MIFFIATTHPKDVRKTVAPGRLDGVTTSSAFLAEEGREGADAVITRYKQLCELAGGDCFTQNNCHQLRESYESRNQRIKYYTSVQLPAAAF